LNVISSYDGGEVEMGARMKRTAGVLVLVAMAAVGLWAQDDSPTPDADGVYPPYHGVTPARLVHATAAVIPPGVGLSGGKHITTLSAVVSADGTVSKIDVVSAKSPLDDAAIAAVKQSQFAPGMLDGKPVPVRAYVWVPFLDAAKPAIPFATPAMRTNGSTRPRPLKTVEAEFSEEARKKGVTGSLLVSLVVTEEGLPANLRVVNPLGAGLDEQALKAVRQYKFEPAALDGVAMAVPLTVEISFRLGRRY
jgi:TonB family protein